MAAFLKMTRKEFLEKHDSIEIAEWQAFMNLEPEVFYPMATRKKEKKQKQTPEEMMAIMIGSGGDHHKVENRQPVKYKSKTRVAPNRKRPKSKRR